MRQRRRAERRNTYASVKLQGSSRESSEQFKQRLLIRVGIFVAILLVTWLALGSYISGFRPPRQIVAEIENQSIQLKDLLPATRIMAASIAVSGQEDTLINPREALELLVGNRVLSKSIAELGIPQPAEVDVNAVLARAFDYASVSESSTSEESESGQSRYFEFLKDLGVSDGDYKEFIAGDIMRTAVNEHFKTVIPIKQEAVFLNWIVAPTSVDAQRAWTRLAAGDPFVEVAAEFNRETFYSDANGSVGWVPRGAFPEFELEIFTANEGDILGPINSSLGFVVLQVSEAVTEATISDDVHRLLVWRAADDWFTQKTSDLVSNIEFDQSDSDWLISNLR